MKKLFITLQIPLYSLIFSLSLLCSCQHNQSSHSAMTYPCADTIPFHAAADTLCQNIVKSIDYIPLLGSDQHILPEVFKAITNDSLIFLGNREYHMITVYDLSGHFRYEINNFGKGHYEYLDLANFTIDDKYVYTIDNVQKQVKVYDISDGHWVLNRPLPYTAWDMAYLAPNRYLFSCIPAGPQGAFGEEQILAAVWETDSTFQTVTRSYLGYASSYYDMIGKRHYFTRSGSNILYHDYQHDGYFVFSPACEAPQFVSIKFDNPRPNNAVPYQDVLDVGYQYLSETPVFTQGYIISEFVEGEENDIYVIDTKNGHHTYHNCRIDAHYQMLPPCCQMGQRYVAYLADAEFYNWLTADGFQRADAETERLLEQGGACLIVYTLK